MLSTQQYYSSDQIKKNEMGRACSTYGERRGACRVLVGNSEGRCPLGRLGIDWRIILKRILEEWDGGVDSIDLVQDRDR
jgi:hypothetical protein